MQFDETNEHAHAPLLGRGATVAIKQWLFLILSILSALGLFSPPVKLVADSLVPVPAGVYIAVATPSPTASGRD